MHRLPDGEEAINVSVRSDEPSLLTSQFRMFLRMVQPKYRIERGIGNVAHVTSITNESMNGVVDVFDIIVPTTTLIRVSGVGKGTIFGLRGDELIG